MKQRRYGRLVILVMALLLLTLVGFGFHLQPGLRTLSADYDFPVEGTKQFVPAALSRLPGWQVLSRSTEKGTITLSAPFGDTVVAIVSPSRRKPDSSTVTLHSQTLFLGFGRNLHDAQSAVDDKLPRLR